MLLEGLMQNEQNVGLLWLLEHLGAKKCHTIEASYLFFATSGSISKITCHGDEDENDAKESQDAPAAIILEISA